MTEFNETLSRWKEGNHLEDLELMGVADVFRKAHESTKIFGERYRLVSNDALLNWRTALSYLKNRGYNGLEEEA